MQWLFIFLRIAHCFIYVYSVKLIVSLNDAICKAKRTIIEFIITFIKIYLKCKKIANLYAYFMCNEIIISLAKRNARTNK